MIQIKKIRFGNLYFLKIQNIDEKSKISKFISFSYYLPSPYPLPLPPPLPPPHPCTSPLPLLSLSPSPPPPSLYLPLHCNT